MIYILPKSQKNQGQRVPLMPAILLYFFLFSVSWITSGNPLHDWTILLVFHKVSHLQPFLASLSSLVVCFHPANVPKYTTFYLIILLLTLANSLLYHLISMPRFMWNQLLLQTCQTCILSLKITVWQPTIGNATCQHCCKSYNWTVSALCNAAILLRLTAQHQSVFSSRLQQYNGVFQQNNVHINLLGTRQTPHQQPVVYQPVTGKVKVLQKHKILSWDKVSTTLNVKHILNYF